MEFDTTKIENKKRGRTQLVTDEQIIAAVKSGLFESQSAIARYFNVKPQTIQKRVKKLRENGLID